MIPRFILALVLVFIFQSAAMADDTDNSDKAIAERAASRIQQLYPLLPPRIGIFLTDPNVVLVLGGARGGTSIVVYRAQPGDIKAFDSLNSVSERSGIKFQTEEAKSTCGEPFDNILVENLHGYELVCSQTRLPGVPRFVAKDGWDGLTKWKDATKRFETGTE